MSSIVAMSLVPPLGPRRANFPLSESRPQTNTPFNKRCRNLQSCTQSWLCIWTALSPFALHQRRTRAKRGSSKDVLNEHWQLGGWKLRGRVVLAPMEQVTDCAFRRLCFELGASFTWTEMVRAASLLKRNNSTTSRIDTFDPSTPTGGQGIKSSSISNFCQTSSMSSINRCIK